MRLAAAALGFAAVGWLALPASGAAGEAGGRVVHGAQQDIAAWPWAGALQFDPPGRRYGPVTICTGAVIAPRFAITAGHCIAEVGAGKFSLVVGTRDTLDETTGTRLKVTDAVVHPRYRPPYFTTDVAVLELGADAPVPAIPLVSAEQEPALTALGAPLRLAGWGVKRTNGLVTRYLYGTAQTVVAPRGCQRRYGKLFSKAKMICTDGVTAGSGACFGDSGGPIVADTATGPVLVATVTAGDVPCGRQFEYHERIVPNLGFIARASGVVPPVPTG